MYFNQLTVACPIVYFAQLKSAHHTLISYHNVISENAKKASCYEPAHPMTQQAWQQKIGKSQPTPTKEMDFLAHLSSM